MGLNNEVSGCYNVPPMDHRSLMLLWPYKNIEELKWHCIDYKHTMSYTHIDMCTDIDTHQHTLHLTHVSLVHIGVGADDSALLAPQQS